MAAGERLMAERTNGNITIVAGLPDAPAPHLDARLSMSRKQTLAFRLRKQGWSYRRISDALGVSYSTVMDWMEMEADLVSAPYAPPPAMVRPALRAPANFSAPISSPVVPDSVVEAELFRRLDGIVAEQQAQADRLAGMEKRLVETVKAEAKSMGKRILDALKVLSKGSKPS